MALRAVTSLLLSSYWSWSGQARLRAQSDAPACLSAVGRAWSPEGRPLRALRCLLGCSPRERPRVPHGSRDHLLSLEMASVSQDPPAVSLSGEDLFLLPDFTLDQGEPSIEGDEKHTDWTGGPRWVSSSK